MKESLRKVLGYILIILIALVTIGYNNHEHEEEIELLKAEAFEAGYSAGYNDIYFYLQDNTSYDVGTWGVFDDGIIGIIYDELGEWQAGRLEDKIYERFVPLDFLEEQVYSKHDWYEYKPEFESQNDKNYDYVDQVLTIRNSYQDQYNENVAGHVAHLAAINANKSNSHVNSKPVSSVTMVYVTNTGSKYHKEGCQYLRESSNEIALSEAKDKGYDPCSRCY